MTQPIGYTQTVYFTQFQDNNPGVLYLGVDLDVEFAALKLTTDQIRANLALIQRDDTALFNGIVTPDSLSSATRALMAGWNPRGAWVTATAYAVKDMVTNSGLVYVCVVAHTGGTFATDLAAGKWMFAATGDVLGPNAGATDGLPAVWNGATGKLLKVATASAIRTSLGSGATGDALYLAATPAAARTILSVPSAAEITAEIGVGDTAVAAGLNIRDLWVNADMQVAQIAAPNLSTSFQYGKVDMWAGRASGGAVSAGTINQSTASAASDTGYALHFAGTTLTGAGKLAARYRMEARDALFLKNKTYFWGVQNWHDIGSSKNATITFNKANAADDFSAVTLIATSGNLAVADQTKTLLSFSNALGDCSNGLEIVVELDSGAITTKNWHLGEVRHAIGAVGPTYARKRFGEELFACERYYCKTFPYATAPAQNVGAGGSLYCKVPIASGCVQAIWRFPRRMRASPTIVTYSPGDATANWWNNSAGGNTANATSGTNDAGTHFASATGLTVGELWSIHATADARQ